MIGRPINGGGQRAGGAFVLAVVLALGGCAAPGPAGAPAISGRIAVRVDSQPPRQFSADFELRGNTEEGLLRLGGPLGTTAAEARWSGTGAALVTAQGSETFADTETLAAATLGERLPLAALFDWLRGRPWPHAPSEPLDNGFAQLGWRIDLSRFAEGWIEAHRDAAPAVTVRARMEPPA